jgi:hypothetical protein
MVEFNLNFNHANIIDVYNALIILFLSITPFNFHFIVKYLLFLIDIHPFIHHCIFTYINLYSCHFWQEILYCTGC